MTGEGAFAIRAFSPADAEAVIALWQACGLVRPWNDPRKDIDRKLSEQPELFLVACAGSDEGAVVASAMIGFDGHRGWVYYLAVAPGMQRQSLGRALMARAERLLIERGCPKLMLMVRSSNAAVLDFYRELGYGEEKVTVMGKRLIPDL
ncbi:GNAT family acetyltransferase [Variovorax sp. RHLX14]|uniref:GNAT family acetyltransferase n=1 Tax=Variovorax sp. RHLX14 TaxID=1259731 RepID=UPI003F453E32